MPAAWGRLNSAILSFLRRHAGPSALVILRFAQDDDAYEEDGILRVRGREELASTVGERDRVTLMRSLLGFLVCAWLLVVTGDAAEHITLRNGFELNCDHRGTPGDTAAGAAASSLVRLYLDASETNYIDVAPAEIVSVEALPEPPAPDPARTSASQTATAKTELTPAELRQLLAAAGAEHDLDVDLLASVVHAESASNAHAVSRTGARGLMQLMPGTAAQLGVKDSFAPEENVHSGTGYLDSLLKRYHDNLALALAAYNAGPRAVDRYHGVPPYRETRAYVARIIHEFNQRYAARQAAALAMAH